jgi:hypothetical protein
MVLNSTNTVGATCLFAGYYRTLAVEASALCPTFEVDSGLSAANGTNSTTSLVASNCTQIVLLCSAQNATDCVDTLPQLQTVVIRCVVLRRVVLCSSKVLSGALCSLLCFFFLVVVIDSGRTSVVLDQV